MGFDLIVVGAGHAGCEAALAGARLGLNTALITLDAQKIAQMSCNPAVGGLAKGQLVCEIDALGGEMGYCTDLSGIHFRILNRSRGPAVQAHRVQVDRNLYRENMTKIVNSQKKLTVIEGDVVGLLVENGVCRGVSLVSRETIPANAVIITCGTFLNGLIHIGDKKIAAGRIGEKPSRGLTEFLTDLGFESGRLKTGTPPRLKGATIDLSKCQPQPGDEPPPAFSRRTTKAIRNQIVCHLTHTNHRTHEIIRQNLDKSAMYGGHIKGVGPRYCPSIEDKVVRFSDKNQHQLFLEPESANGDEYYLNGFSSSLPEDIQIAAARTVQGLEEVEFNRPAYAIEYDYFPPYQLQPSLETKRLPGLFMAGQINGTSGYEEAAAQGLIAGINAVLKIRGEKPLILKRSQAYIGVLIDDLTTKSTSEPYRMFTSRAEYRLFLREDNAMDRLAEIGIEIGLITDGDRAKIEAEAAARKNLIARFKTQKVSLPMIKEAITVAEAAKRNDIELSQIIDEIGAIGDIGKKTIEGALIDIKYEGYIERQRLQVERYLSLESQKIPQWLDYFQITGLKKEAKEKLAKFRPTTIGQASRISGVSPGDVALLLVHLKR